MALAWLILLPRRLFLSLEAVSPVVQLKPLMLFWEVIFLPV
jgi:hypothetical protein